MTSEQQAQLKKAVESAQVLIKRLWSDLHEMEMRHPCNMRAGSWSQKERTDQLLREALKEIEKGDHTYQEILTVANQQIVRIQDLEQKLSGAEKLARQAVEVLRRMVESAPDKKPSNRSGWLCPTCNRRDTDDHEEMVLWAVTVPARAFLSRPEVVKIGGGK